VTTSVLVVATLLAVAVATWPARAAASRRLAEPMPRSTAVDAVDAVDPADAADPADPWGEPAAGPALRPDLVMELVACALRAGLPVSEALAAATARARSPYLENVVSRLRLGVPTSSAWARPPPEYDGLARALIVADLSGAPAAAVVTRAAADQRAAQRERAELAAARLGVQLVLPLGLAVLPGFVLLAVVPIVIGLASGLTSLP
jgi:hypothetical protein